MSGANTSAGVQLKSDRLLDEKTRGRKRRKGAKGGGEAGWLKEDGTGGGQEGK